MFSLMTNEAIKDFIGFTVLDAAITGLVILIVCKFLLNPSNIHSAADSIAFNHEYKESRARFENGDKLPKASSRAERKAYRDVTRGKHG